MADDSTNPQSKERINYKTPEGLDIEVPIIRAGMPEVFVALQPPDAKPYIMAPRNMDAKEIVEFFRLRVAVVEEMRQDMLKRFAKSSYGKCRFQTGDVAYVMGRPFQLRVYPLATKKMKNVARGRATAKYSIASDVSLMTLYVVHPKNYDEARRAFNSYAESVVLRNAKSLANDFAATLLPDMKVPPVRMRAMRGRWSAYEAGALWLSNDLLPYPPDCLVYTILKEFEELSPLPEFQFREEFARILPGWRAAAQMLSERAEPYSLQ
ncbi:MAG: DUF45 domain-containing protein [Eggerthellaceae bacterium]|nr:DUF45 domain-containing protein [Eggerthellaceae bacterium]